MTTYHIRTALPLGLPMLAIGAATIAAPPMLHLATAVAALVLGGVVLYGRKGTASHRTLGRAWVLLMTAAAVSSFWLSGLNNGFSVIHLLSVWTLIAMALAIWFIRRGNVNQHRRFMIGTYLGLAGAAIGALMPGRMLYQIFLG